jgi:hypothetical protein
MNSNDSSPHDWTARVQCARRDLPPPVALADVLRAMHAARPAERPSLLDAFTSVFARPSALVACAAVVALTLWWSADDMIWTASLLATLGGDWL